MLQDLQLSSFAPGSITAHEEDSVQLCAVLSTTFSQLHFSPSPAATQSRAAQTLGLLTYRSTFFSWLPDSCFLSLKNPEADKQEIHRAASTRNAMCSPSCSAAPVCAGNASAALNGCKGKALTPLCSFKVLYCNIIWYSTLPAAGLLHVNTKTDYS